MRLHRKALAHRKLFHMGTFDTEAFTDRRFSQRSSLHRVSYTHRMATECAKYFPVLLCTSQYYLVLQACTKHVTVLLRTSKLVQSTSQYYFVLQDMHKVLPSTTLYHKACTKHLPVLYMYIYHIISLVWSRNPFSSCVEGMEIKLPLGLGWYHADPSFTPPFY